jgi:hypothetical protein
MKNERRRNKEILTTGRKTTTKENQQGKNRGKRRKIHIQIKHKRKKRK